MAEGEEAAVVPPEPVPKLPDEELEGRLAFLAECFNDCSADTAKMASRAERTANPPTADEEGGAEAAAALAAFELKGKQLAYGEVPPEMLHKMFNALKDHEDLPLFEGKGIFLDLGSGVGKACVAAGLLHPFEKCVGVETLQCLNDFAAKGVEKYTALQLPEGVVKPEVQLVKADFVQLPEAEGGAIVVSPDVEALAPTVAVCLCDCTAFGPQQIQAMADLATKMPDGSYFITVGQALPDAVTFGGNRHPLQRRAQAFRKILAKPGTDPAAVELPEKADFEKALPVGWVEVLNDEVQMIWGPTRCFLYKQIPGDFTRGNPWGLASWGAGAGPWEQLVGLGKDDALNRLKTAREDLTVELLEPDPETGEIKEPEEASETRVLIRFDQTTGLVTEAPKVG
eukprot:TRINITY_DN2733_c0_g3_i1.p1 TRINITY_DN2733_c0_g3~~TRINITY_DN2733_c0_g3_i1.p1  ORF type:complete len:398 (-),score=89.62 TRINITY_DN2733_c0_g3_i1:251-1444(-)